MIAVSWAEVWHGDVVVMVVVPPPPALRQPYLSSHRRVGLAAHARFGPNTEPEPRQL